LIDNNNKNNKDNNNRLFDRNIPLYYRYKPEPLLETTDTVLYWDRSITSDKTVDFDRPDTVLSDKERTKQQL
jgi:hypothetical protein